MDPAPASNVDLRPGALLVREIFASIEGLYGVTRAELTSPARHREIARARQALYAALRKPTWEDGQHRFSLPRIAALAGRTDHTTIIKGLRAHEARVMSRVTA